MEKGAVRFRRGVHLVTCKKAGIGGFIEDLAQGGQTERAGSGEDTTEAK
ncbi:MAG TPA: hypothetical protein VMT53_05075 [Terriglobales bacterium]|nr:hypothetical protein [Terriglobales bacterium]